LSLRYLRSFTYFIYKKYQSNWFVATITNYIFVNIIGKLKKNKFSKILFENKYSQYPIVAFVCDEFTWQNFKNECFALYITPYNWKSAFQKFKPKIFFCESTWSGCDEFKDAWRGRVYKNNNVIYNNRTTLMKILKYCKENNIPTVFWNKEDPTFFDSKSYNFVDTALLFDFIFTTSEECVSLYKELGHHNVYVMQFAFSPKIYFYNPSIKKEKKAVFAGSWYADQPQRCVDMEAVFDMIIESGIRLEIYNRQSNSSNPLYRYPEKYQKYIFDAVSVKELGEIYRKSEFAININTVKNSSTMFSRRVFELMACGCIVISNMSAGLKKMFPNSIWYLGEKFDMERESKFREINLKIVSNYTCQNQIKMIMDTCLSD
jgi:hypothetical protein